MIVITIKKNDDLYLGVNIKGHAEMAEYGKDIVCAGVSTLSYSLINYLLEINENIYYVLEEGDTPHINLELTPEQYKIEAIQNGFRYFDIGVSLIYQSYKDYIHLTYQEV